MSGLKIKTKVLRQAYEQSGPKKGEPLILVHGWPDSPRTWDKVLPALHQAGYQTIVPYLRGYGPSSFRDPLLGRKPRRTGTFKSPDGVWDISRPRLGYVR
jgi:pimeloyl-ACP methyl ester carboxylesterase